MEQHQGSSDPNRYLDPKVLARISRLELKARLVVEGYISGLHRSPYHGFSVEFAEHREYVPGDDVRHIDWKVYGRSDRYYIKQYEEETNLKAHILLDASESMGYPFGDPLGKTPLADGGQSKETAREAGGANGRRISKYEYGTYVAASLAYLILRQQDAAGIALFDDEVRHYLPPSSNVKQLPTLFDTIEKGTLNQKTNVGTIMNQMADRVKKRSLFLVISDLLDSLESVQNGLKMLRYRGHEVLVFHVLDREELSFPFQRMTLFEGLEGLPDLVADPRALRKGYLAELERYLESVRKTCREHRIDYVLLSTDEKLHVALSSYLAKRSGTQKT